MPVTVQVGPPQISIHQGQTVLTTQEDGQINWPSEKGLYFFDTRVVSSWAIYANGEPWEPLNGSAISYYASRIFLINRSLLTENGLIQARTLGLIVSRSISGGMHEDLDVINHGMKRVVFQLEIALRSDFEDIFEVKCGRIVRAAELPRSGQHRASVSAQPIGMATSPAPWQSLPLCAQRERCTPTDASASRWHSSPASNGIAAFSIRFQTATGILPRRLTASATAQSRTTLRRWRIG
jgi:hypothetical protein